MKTGKPLAQTFVPQLRPDKFSLTWDEANHFRDCRRSPNFSYLLGCKTHTAPSDLLFGAGHK